MSHAENLRAILAVPNAALSVDARAKIEGAARRLENIEDKFSRFLRDSTAEAIASGCFDAVLAKRFGLVMKGGAG